MFFVVLSMTLMGLSLYVIKRASGVFGLSKRVERTALVIGAIAFIALIGLRALRGVVTDAVAAPVGVVVFGVLLSLLISAVLLLAFWELPAALARIGLWVHRRSKDEPAPAEQAPPAEPAEPAPPPVAAVAPPRRVFLQQAVTGSALAVGAGAAGYGALFGRHDYAIEEVPVRLAGLPPTLEGFTIAQLSDTHLGTFVGDDAERAGSEMCRRARPNLIVLTGDLLDHDPQYAPRLGRWIEELSRIAPVVAVVGNHDYYAGIKPVADAIVRGGATLLDNHGIPIGDDGGRFALLGVDDVWASRRHPGRGPNLDKAIAAVPRDLPRVLLCHNPSFFPDAAGEVGLMLAGHTHGGQVNLLVRPANYVLPHGYVAGRYERDGSTLYVNRGFGTAGPPARVQSAPEITKIILIG